MCVAWDSWAGVDGRLLGSDWAVDVEAGGAGLFRVVEGV